MSDPIPSSPAESENIAVIFLGFTFATFLYGLSFFQMYLYFSRYPKDYTVTKVLVAILFILETATTGLVSHLLYHYLITMIDVRMEVLYATIPFCLQVLLSVILIVIVQLFFAARLYTVCGGPTSFTSRFVSMVVLFCAFIAFAFGLTSVVQLFQHRQLSAFAMPTMEIIAGISQGFALAANIIIFIAMCWSLRPSRYPDMIRPVGVFENLTVVFVGRALGLVIIQLAYFCTFVALPGKPYWIALQMVAPKIYANTVFGLLNTREVRHGIGFNEEESMSYRQDSQINGLPSALRFRSMKATKESISFSQQGENSKGSEIEEASKSYTDEQNLESIRSHCSELHAYDKASLS